MISGARQWKWMLIDSKWPAYCADSTVFLVTFELFVNANIIQILIDRKQKYFKSHFHYKAHKLSVLIQQTLITCIHTSLIDVLFSNEFDCVNYLWSIRVEAALRARIRKLKQLFDKLALHITTVTIKNCLLFGLVFFFFFSFFIWERHGKTPDCVSAWLSRPKVSEIDVKPHGKRRYYARFDKCNLNESIFVSEKKCFVY